ncbi:hypothetical protein LguiB_021788 [Lonicera macranthoides]
MTYYIFFIDLPHIFSLLLSQFSLLPSNNKNLFRSELIYQPINSTLSPTT